MNPAPVDNLFRFLFGVDPWGILKVPVLFALLLYVVFAVVVVKQVHMMTETLCDQLELPLKIVAAIHLAGAIFVFVLALIIL